MLICQAKNCDCEQHLVLRYMANGINDMAVWILQKHENYSDLVDASGKTLLHYAVAYTNIEMMKYFLDDDEYNVNAQDSSGVSPLMLAVERNAITVEILLADGADVYATDSHGQSIFELAFYGTLRITRNHDASRAEVDIRIIQMLVDKVNEDFSTKDNNLEQWLMSARDVVKLILITFGSDELIEFILENAGYQIDYSDESTQGCTALHCALIMAKLNNARLLMEHGANVDVLDEKGCMPLYYYSPILDDIDVDSELLICMLTYSKNVSFADERCFKSIEKLLKVGKKNTVSWTVLLSCVDAETCLCDGTTLLSCLINNKNEDVMDILDELKIKFDPNQCLSNEHTILIEAVRKKCPQKVELLLQHGADVNMTLWEGKSALMHLYHYEYFDGDWSRDTTKIMELLLLYGSRDAQPFFCDHRDLSEKFCFASTIILAHLALLQAQDSSYLTSESWMRIESNAQTKTLFEACSTQLEQMKTIKVHGTVTWFKLMTETDGKLVVYARNRELLLKFSKSIENSLNFEPYYVNYAHKRLLRAADAAKLHDEAAAIIETLTGISTDTYHAIIYKIIGYLERKDMENLCDIESHPPLQQ